MFGIGTQEILIILLVALILFGSKRIPEVARALGKGMGDFRRAARDVQREIDLEILKESSQRQADRQPPDPSGKKDAPAAEPGKERHSGSGGLPGAEGKTADNDKAAKR